MENIFLREIFRNFKIMNITYIFMKGRISKKNKETVVPNDFFYFYNKFEESENVNSNFLEVNSKNTLNPLRNVYSLIEKYRRKRTGLSFYGNEFIKFKNFKIILKTNKVILINESVSFSLLFLFSIYKKIKKVEITIFLMGLFSKLDLSNNLHKNILYKMLNVYDKFIFVGKSEFNYAKNNFPEWSEKFFFLPFSVDQNFWKPQTNSIKNEEILFIGNDLNRDFDFTFNLAKKMPELSFTLISNHFKQYKQIENINVLDGNWSKGNITDIELRNYYDKSILTIVPLINSIQPSGQSVSLQSMSMNTPVIITKTDGFWDYDHFENNKNIIFAEKNEIELWISLIQDLLKNEKLYSNLAKNAKKTMLETYDQDILFKKLLDIISS